MSSSTKVGTVALVIRLEQDSPVLVDQFSDDAEINAFESAAQEGTENPLDAVYERRQKLAREDEEFGNYVEDLLSQPFVRPEIQEHGVQWLKSKLKIENFQKCENEASKVIADYAFRVFLEDPSKTDFLLAGPMAKVRIRVLPLPRNSRKAA